MVTGPLVTVVIPTYRGLDTLREAISSVRAQTYRRWEIVVASCGVDDGTEETISSFRDDRIRVLRGIPPGNVARPRNLGVREGRGEVLAFLDHDDVWVRRRLEWSVEARSAPGGSVPARFVYGGLRLWYDRSYPLRWQIGSWLNPKVAPERFATGWVADPLVRGNFIGCGSVLVEREVFDLAGGFCEAEELFTVEDYDLWLRCACLVPFSAVPRPVYWYRMHRNQASRRSDWRLLQMRALHRLASWLDAPSRPELGDGVDPAALGRSIRAQIESYERAIANGS